MSLFCRFLCYFILLWHEMCFHSIWRIFLALFPELEGPVSLVSVSSDNLLVMACSSAGILGFLDVKGCSYNTVMRSHTDTVLGFSVDGIRRYLTTASSDGTVRVWSMDSLQQVCKHHVHDCIFYKLSPEFLINNSVAFCCLLWIVVWLCVCGQPWLCGFPSQWPNLLLRLQLWYCQSLWHIQCQTAGWTPVCIHKKGSCLFTTAIYIDRWQMRQNEIPCFWVQCVNNKILLIAGNTEVKWWAWSSPQMGSSCTVLTPRALWFFTTPLMKTTMWSELFVCMRMHETQHNAKWDLKWTQYNRELNGDRRIFSWQLVD